MKLLPSRNDLAGLGSKPGNLFWAFVFLHLFSWTIVACLVSPNVPLDVIEGYAWGREWLIGTYKHPPMQSWWLEIMSALTGHAPWAHFLASQIAIAIAFWAVWKTGLRLTNEKTALLGVLLLEGVIYFNFTTPEFNPNVLQVTFCALIGHSFYCAVKDNQTADWALLGLWSAGGLYSKYTSALLIGILALLLIIHPFARQRLKSYGPYLAISIMLALIAPHVSWLFSHDFQPFSYADSRTDHSTDFIKNITNSLRFIGSQLAAIGAALIIFLSLSGGKISFKEKDKSFDTVFLHTVALAPLATLLFLSLFAGIKIRDMWGSSLWMFIGLWALINLKYDITPRSIKRFAIAWGFVFALGLATYAGFEHFGPLALNTGKRVHFPGKEMSEQITRSWADRYKTPLKYAIGDTWLAGNLAYYADSPRPHVFIQADPTISGWINGEDVHRNGGILLWCGKHCADENSARSIPGYFSEIFPSAEVQQPLTLSWQTVYPVKPAIIGWAIVPPKL
ncbi:MAG: glycosyltransferase family 39 protein [Alphaproteobacteria bacterium]|nr:glycosyltransferase family 39 protein [Alphaproteobacteria bacterium]